MGHYGDVWDNFPRSVTQKDPYSPILSWLTAQECIGSGSLCRERYGAHEVFHSILCIMNFYPVDQFSVLRVTTLSEHPASDGPVRTIGAHQPEDKFQPCAHKEARQHSWGPEHWHRSPGMGMFSKLPSGNAKLIVGGQLPAVIGKKELGWITAGMKGAIYAFLSLIKWSDGWIIRPKGRRCVPARCQESPPNPGTWF